MDTYVQDIVEMAEPWTSFDIRDAGLMQTVLAEHISRDDRARGWDLSDGYACYVPDTEGVHVYTVADDGVLRSTYLHGGEDDREDAMHRHAHITRNRFNALVGRANKTAEFVDYISMFDAYAAERSYIDDSLSETVLDTYLDGPVAGPGVLEERIAEVHHPAVVELLRRDQPELLWRAQTADIPDQGYDAAVKKVVGGESYADWDFASLIDFEVCTKTRSMTDFWEDTVAGEEYEEIYGAIMDAATDRLAAADT